MRHTSSNNPPMPRYALRPIIIKQILPQHLFIGGKETEALPKL